MKITVYTISDCKFSKEEKDYLTANKLAFEEKNLETNKEFLTEMLAVSNNFAGTPVTKIEKDDGQIVVLKGFTKDEFDKALNLTPAPTTAPSPEVKPEPKVEPKVEAPPAPTTPAPTPEVPKEAPAPEALKETPTPTPTAPAPAQPDNDPLKSILADLENKAEPVAEPPVPPVVANAAANPAPPVIPNFDDKK